MWLDFIVRLIFKPRPNFSLPIHPKRGDLFSSVHALKNQIWKVSDYIILAILLSIPAFWSSSVFTKNINYELDNPGYEIVVAVIYFALLIVLVSFIVWMSVEGIRIGKDTLREEAHKINRLINNANNTKGEYEYYIAQLINQSTNKVYPKYYVITEWILYLCIICSLIIGILNHDSANRVIWEYVNRVFIVLLLQLILGITNYNAHIRGARIKSAGNLLTHFQWYQDNTPITWSASWIYTSQAYIPEWLVKDDDVMLKQFDNWLQKTPYGKQSQAVFQDEDKWPTPYWLYRNIGVIASNSTFNTAINASIGFFICVYLPLSFIYLSLEIFNNLVLYPNSNLSHNYFVISTGAGSMIGFVAAIKPMLNISKKIKYEFIKIFSKSNDGLEFLNNYFFGKEGDKSIFQAKIKQLLKNNYWFDLVLSMVYVGYYSALVYYFYAKTFKLSSMFETVLLDILLVFNCYFFASMAFKLMVSLLGLGIRVIEKHLSARAAVEILSLMGWDKAEYRISTPRKFYR